MVQMKTIIMSDYHLLKRYYAPNAIRDILFLIMLLLIKLTGLSVQTRIVIAIIIGIPQSLSNNHQITASSVFSFTRYEFRLLHSTAFA